MEAAFRLTGCAGLVFAAWLSATERVGANPCAIGAPSYFECKTEQTTYHVRLPAFTNPNQPIPTVVILHDAGGTGAELLDDPRLTEAFLGKGFALLAPDALPRDRLRVTIRGSKNESLLAGAGFSRRYGKYSDKKFVMLGHDGKLRDLDYGNDTGWYYFNIDRAFFTRKAPGEFQTGSRYLGRDEILMLRDVLKLATKEFNTDPDPQLIIGLGHGGSLLWQIACHAPALGRLLAPVDGAFWDEVPGRCRPGARLVHTHNRNSSFWPLDGAQGGKNYYNRTSIYRNIEMLLDTNGCELRKKTGDSSGGEVRHTVWPYCRLGDQVELITTNDTFEFQAWWLDEIIGRIEHPDLEGEPVSIGPKVTKPGDKAGFMKADDRSESPFKRPR